MGSSPSTYGQSIVSYRKIIYAENAFREQYVLGAAQAEYLAKYPTDPNQVMKTWSNAGN